MEKISEREFLLWQRFLKNEWNKPSRNDWYLMQIAALIETFLRQKHVETEEMKIDFEVAEEKGTKDPDEMTEEEIKRWADQQSAITLANLSLRSAQSGSLKR